MCGFSGLYDPSERQESLGDHVRRMTATLVHRGPDAGGIYVRDGISIGHRRLSILDLSPAGAQPMSLGENGPTIVFNGEVYNFSELRFELEGLGHAFKGHSDTEVMLHAYAEWGLPGLRRFEGIFAFALWDPADQRLVLMRDRLGVKPLFYSRNGSRLVFGSEIKSLLAGGEMDMGVDSQALSEYLWYGNAYEERTIYRSVRSLLPGHWLIVEKGAFRTEPWWRLEDWLETPAFQGDPQEAVTVVREAVDAAVKRQLVADVPVGIFLSGGIDSSAIAAAAVRVQSKRLSSFAVGFDFARGVNELPKARRVAKHLGLDHHEVEVGGGNLEDILMDLARAHDEPFADAANIPLFLLARQLKGSIKVVLQGDGGDELFAGYRRYAILRNSALWRTLPVGMSSVVRLAFGNTGRRMARMMEAAGAKDPALRMALLLTTETLYDAPTSLLNPEALNHLNSNSDPFLAYRKCAGRFRDADPVQQMMLTDTTLQLPSQFLTKVDRSTMACGLEARVPLLDDRLVQLALKLPAAWNVSRTEKKILLRKSLRDRIPDDILDAPKMGFGVPYEHWLRGPLYNFACDAVFEAGFLTRFGFDRTKLESAFKEHRLGTRDRGFTLWKVFQLALWVRTCQW